MANKRTADVLLGAFQDEMVTRRKFDVKNAKDEVIMTLYFKPITRYARVKAQHLAGPNADALVVSTQLLCQMAEKEDGTLAFDMSDAPILQRQLPEKVLNDLELFLNNIELDIDTAKKE